MISINSALDIIINESPFLEEWLYNEYINLSSFALYIKPKVELLTKKEVTIWAIKMALSRYVKDKQKTITYKKFSIDDFFIKKNICIIYLEKNNNTLNIIKEINSLWILKEEDYLSIIQGWKNIWIIYSQSLDEVFSKIIPRVFISLKMTNLSLIWVYLEETKINEIWIVYTLTKKINFSNINILEIISNYKEVHFIVKNEDLKRTIDSIVV